MGFASSEKMKIKPPFQVRTAGIIENDPYHSTPGTREDDFMLTVFLSGRGRYTNKTTDMIVTEKMVGIVGPDDAGILVSDTAYPYTHYFCRFNGSYAKYLAHRILTREGIRFFRCDKVIELADIIREMGPIAREKLPNVMGRVELLLAKALLLLADVDEETTLYELTPFAIEHYFRTHISEPIELDRIAEYFNISKPTLCRRVKQLTGKTVLQIGEQIKIEWAKTLLATGRPFVNVSEVARRVGYDDPLYFSRVFRKHIGIPPISWQRGLAKKNK